MTIYPLSKDLRNKISAGEVVERPASVVKELLENSIDAGSTEIEIVLEKGGHQTIQVRDNGCGMAADDLPASVKRYHTSKISELDDLFAINTLGFRGEALASISSVADLSIISSNGNGEGAELPIKSGKLGKVQPAPEIGGTEITIRNLFYNTPARKKFLKSPRVELRKVIDVVRRFGLSYPEVSFSLISDDKKIISVLSESLEERINSLFDKTYRKNLLSITITKGDYTFTGFVGNLNLVRRRPGEQYLFLNRRFIKDRLLNSAVYSAYRSLVKRGEFPFFVINLAIPADQVDVNVHPMKIEARFKDEWRVYHVLRSGVNDTIQPILKTIPDLEKRQYDYQSYFKETATQKDSKQAKMNFRRQEPIENILQTTQLKRAKDYASNLAIPGTETDNIIIDRIWQIHSKYIISEINSGLVIIDQHVAHERVLYEEAMMAFESTSMASQTLLFPELLEFSSDEFDGLLDILPYLEKIGFKVKKVGDYSISVEATPSDVSWGNERQVIRDIIDDFLETRKTSSSYKESIAASFACKAAVKAGDKLTHDELQLLVNRLFATEHPYYCPHGRPIIVQMSLEELDKRFERI
jgi:DNA mismatch repair protein MutL|tara:strand:- start:3853 stop:5604 length:1752 start_codon:yes stop_codon:yes gene_type:complete